MSELTSLTIAEAREKLRAKEITADRTDRGLSLGDRCGQWPVLNAYIAVTPDKARDMAKASDATHRRRQGRRAGRHSARHQGPVRHRGRAHAGLQPHPRRLQAALRIDRHPEPLGRRRRHARQAQHGRVRHGLVQRDLLLRRGHQPLARPRRLQPADCVSGRLVRRFGCGRCGASLRRRDRHRHRRLDPPAGGLHRHGRHQADLRPLLALGHRSPSPPRSTRPARSPATCATPRSC